MDFETDLAAAQALEVDDLAASIKRIGFECTRCGDCCRHEPADEENAAEDHTATIFPDEVRDIQAAHDLDWSDVARPIPFGLTEGEDGPEGETLEWALPVDGCGDCRFYEEHDGVGGCGIYENRPLICQTYPFTVALNATAGAMGKIVDSDGDVRAHECQGLGADISMADARELAATLKARSVRELEEAIAIRDKFAPLDPDPGVVVVHDSDGPKHADGTPYTP